MTEDRARIAVGYSHIDLYEDGRLELTVATTPSNGTDINRRRFTVNPADAIELGQKLIDGGLRAFRQIVAPQSR